MTFDTIAEWLNWKSLRDKKFRDQSKKRLKNCQIIISSDSSMEVVDRLRVILDLRNQLEEGDSLFQK